MSLAKLLIKFSFKWVFDDIIWNIVPFKAVNSSKLIIELFCFNKVKATNWNYKQARIPRTTISNTVVTQKEFDHIAYWSAKELIWLQEVSHKLDVTPTYIFTNYKKNPPLTFFNLIWHIPKCIFSATEVSV